MIKYLCGGDEVRVLLDLTNCPIPMVLFDGLMLDGLVVFDGLVVLDVPEGLVMFDGLVVPEMFDDGLVVPEMFDDGLVVLDGLVVPDDGLVMLDGLVVPDDDLVVLDGLVVPDDDLVVLDGLVLVLVLEEGWGVVVDASRVVVSGISVTGLW